MNLDSCEHAFLGSGADCDTDDKLDAFVREKSASAYHPSCTCKMGDPAKDPMTVVDSSTRCLLTLSQKKSSHNCPGSGQVRQPSAAAISQDYKFFEKSQLS